MRPGGGGQVGDDERGGAAAQRLFHAPEQILTALRGGEEQAVGAVVGAGEGAGAFGVEAVRTPGGRDPEHRAARGPDEQHGEAVAGGAAGFVQAGLCERQRAEEAQGRARAVLLAGEERGGHGGECSVFAECSQVGVGETFARKTRRGIKAEGRRAIACPPPGQAICQVSAFIEPFAARQT